MKGCHAAKRLTSLLLVAAARVYRDPVSEKRTRQEEEEGESEEFPKDAINQNTHTHTPCEYKVWLLNNETGLM